MIGQTFDLIVAENGITADLSDIEFTAFVTVDGSELLSDLTLSSFDSGIFGDPDSLLRIDETMFSFALVEDDTILRATLIRTLATVPEPASLFVLLPCLLAMFVRRPSFGVRQLGCRFGWRGIPMRSEKRE